MATKMSVVSTVRGGLYFPFRDQNIQRRGTTVKETCQCRGRGLSICNHGTWYVETTEQKNGIAVCKSAALAKCRRYRCFPTTVQYITFTKVMLVCALNQHTLCTYKQISLVHYTNPVMVRTAHLG